jgi:hypothetical protein
MKLWWDRKYFLMVASLVLSHFNLLEMYCNELMNRKEPLNEFRIS